ncbi:MAG TPA: pilus assembly protein PilM [Pontiella sp.]
MIKKSSKKNQSIQKLSSIVGIDFGTTATKLVKLKSGGKGSLELIGIEMLPPVDFEAPVSQVVLPDELRSNYCALAYSGSSAVVRMVNTPLDADEKTNPQTKLRGLLNVGEDFRASASLLVRGAGKKDSSLLAAAVPLKDVEYMLKMFPSGPPAPASLEVSGLSFITAFLNAHGSDCKDSTVCLVEAGETVTHYAFISKGTIVLLGKFAFGGRTLRKKLASDLGVDEELAASILEDRSINISTSINAVMNPFVKQLSISKDFIERHQGCRVEKFYASGGLSLLSGWVSEFGSMVHTDVETWNPLNNIEVDSSVISPELEKEATRFSAAIGAAIGGIL